MEALTVIVAIFVAALVAFLIGKQRGKQQAERAARPMLFYHVFKCDDCGHEQRCNREDVGPGAVLACPGCQQRWGHLSPNGNKAWIKLSGGEHVYLHRVKTLNPFQNP